MARTRRTPREQLEDAFADLSIEDQVKMLETFHSLHRWSQRERNRKPPENGQQALPVETPKEA